MNNNKSLELKHNDFNKTREMFNNFKRNKKLTKLKPFRVTWKDIVYAVPQKSVKGRGEKIILNGVSGYFDSGQLTAIMGPSGSGKSTLLGCICGRNTTGLSGSITISTDIEVKFAFISQENYILQRITVREALMYASKLKNESTANHKEICEDVLKKLMIEKCADNRPMDCSGGQLKRVLIGLELVSKPNILILDEPTSGLDSVTTWQLINFLIKLTRQMEAVAVVITIHQPSARLFNLLDQIYLLSCEGQCIYNGVPTEMLNYFSEQGLQCPQFTNPSDYALEVAAKEYGGAKLLTLSTVMKIKAMELSENNYQIKSVPNYRTWSDIKLLTERSFKSMIRDPFMLPMRVIGFISTGLLISVLFGSDSGILSGCKQEFALGDGKNLIEKTKAVFADIFENCAGLAFFNLLGWFGGIFPVLLIFPTELEVFIQEYGNGYYSSFAYFMSKVLSDIPFSLLLPNLASIPIYVLTGQYLGQMWRLYNFVFIFLLISFNSSAMGFLIGSLLSDYPTAIGLIGMLSLVPLILLSGIMVRVESMPIYFQYLTSVNYIRFSLVGSLINSYGFDRCNETFVNNNETDFMDIIPPEKMLEIYSSDKINSDALISTMKSVLNGITEDDRSMVLTHFQLNDGDYYSSILMLFFHLILYRTLTYLSIKQKIKSLK